MLLEFDSLIPSSSDNFGYDPEATSSLSDLIISETVFLYRSEDSAIMETS